jgi:hypothetical protein
MKTRERERERNLISFRTIAHTPVEREKNRRTTFQTKSYGIGQANFTYITIKAMVAKQCDRVLAIGKREQFSVH